MPPLRGSHLNFITTLEVKNYGDALSRTYRKFADMCNRVDTVPQSGGRTDTQTKP